ncbi:MAG: hypothetical protein D4R74_10690 [Betaproteobacteria bacterium]|nr:MAG: hypothetical protein D4R74_10690 [Betaproteobacteria bacterium]
MRRLNLVRGRGDERVGSSPSGGDGIASAPRRSPPQSAFRAAGSAAAALVAVACAFGPMQDQSVTRDAATGDGIDTSRSTMDNFLSESRRYLGL